MLRRVLIASLLWWLCGLAAAQDSHPSDYEVALSQALDAHARGEYEAARLFMERAHQLEPSARTLRGLGIVAFAQKRHLSAIRYLDEALASDVKKLPDDLRAAAEELLAHAWAQVGRYEVVIDPPEGDFMIDGQAPDLYAPATVVLEPGPHILTARGPARAPYELRFEARAGAHETMRLILAVPPPPKIVEKPVPQVAVAAPAPGATLRPSFYTPSVRWVGLGAGAALLGTGIALWSVGYARLQEVDARCDDMDPAGCTHADARRLYDHRHIGALSISSSVLMGAGALTLATVASLELWQAVQRRRARVDISLGPTSALLRGRF